MKQVLLYFGETPQIKEKVCHILKDMELPYILVHDDDTAQTVGHLLGLNGFEVSQDKGIHVDMNLMLLQDIKDEEISAFNQASKAAQCDMKQKAMLTQHNKQWKLIDLLSEIKKEHAYFQYAENIHALLLQNQNLIIDEYTKASWVPYEQAFYTAYELLKKEHTLDEMKQGYKQLVTAKQRLQKIK